MRSLTDECLMVSGGNGAYVAAGRGGAVYSGAATLINATQTLNEFGQHLGQVIFDATNPESLGQTQYTEEDIEELYC